MTNGDNFALPGSGYDQLTKILHAYALCGDKPVNLPEVASKAGVHRTEVSRNAGFLVSLKLLSTGKAKSLTPEGKTLAIAVGHCQEEDVAVAWRRTLLANPSTKSVVDMLKVQKTVPQEQFVGKVATALGVPASKTTKTGLNSLVEIMTKSGLVTLKNDTYELGPTDGAFKSESAEEDTTSGTLLADEVVAGSSKLGTPSAAKDAGLSQDDGSSKLSLGSIPIHVNIELHLPASSEQAVYDALFKSIRENLLR